MVSLLFMCNTLGFHGILMALSAVGKLGQLNGDDE